MSRLALATRPSTAFVPNLGCDLTVTDFFAGCGGGSEGLKRAGFTIVTAANHWQKAVDSHQANHPDAEHICQDLNAYDMRKLKRTRGLWASVICTEASPAGGNRAPMSPDQLELLQQGSISKDAWDRTRACAYDVIRATEIWQYDWIVVENVVGFITRWALFAWWYSVWDLMGYNVQIVSASSAHLGGEEGDPEGLDPAAQWRDRIYIVITKKSIPLPEVTPRPASWCEHCEKDVRGVQSWRDTKLLRSIRFKVGDYREQYDYRCPDCRRVVEPYVMPAASIIDWSDVGYPIGERKERGDRVLVKNTRQRIKLGIQAHYPQHFELLNGGSPTGMPVPLMVTVTHGTKAGAKDPGRVRKVTEAPFPTRTVKRGDGLITLPPGAFIDVMRKHSTGIPLDGPVRTMSTARHHWLVVPYRKGRTRTVLEPVQTQATKPSMALIGVDDTPYVEVTEDDIDRSLYRMFTWRESLRAQSFADSYQVLGNPGECQIQAGNAVSVNASQWLGTRIRRALEGAAA